MIKSVITPVALLTVAILGYKCPSRHAGTDPGTLRIEHDEQRQTIAVYRPGENAPILVQNARIDYRPYVHPIVAPDGGGLVTENQPAHHPHQTGLYWGFTRVNGRDYFHHPQGDYWRRVSAGVLDDTVDEPDGGDDEARPGARWQTVYDLLDEEGQAILTETQTWTMRDTGGKYILDLEWRGQARTTITIGEYDYGGLFLRMPWRPGIPGEVVNAVRDRDERADGQRAMWLDVGVQIEGRDDFARLAIFDHSDNKGFPTPWRVDAEMGVGPSRAVMGDWTIGKGETEVIRYRIVVYTGAFNDVELTAAWEDYIGDHSTYSTASTWAIARQAGWEAEFLTPDQAADNMTLIDGFRVTAWAGEPEVTNPMAFAWDDRGRLWVAENHDYETRDTGFSAGGNSRILILEDTNRDGYADSRKVFLEGIAFPAAIAVGFDGLFLGAPPHLLFVPDHDGDDRADMDDIEILLTGWGIDDRHETINSLHWGPDGWLYGLQGYATDSIVGKPRPGAKRIYTHNDPFPESLEDLLDGGGTEINGGVWRYHPVKARFEVVAHGLSNPWGIDHDAKGQLLVTACVIPHLWHIVPGGVYHRQGGSHFNPYIYDDIKTIADHRHRSAHGGASVYLSDAFPEAHFGRIFMANIHEHAVLSDTLERVGSGFVAHHGDDFLRANNAAWVGFSTEIGPDGGLYILDWHDRDICGSEVIDGETGRIFKIMPELSHADEWEGRYADVSAMTDDQLIDLQTKKSAWHARRARVNLQYRASKRELGAGTHERLRVMFRTASSPDWRLRAMWALHVTGGFSEQALIAALDDRDEYVRGWAIQMLAEELSRSAVAVAKFHDMAKRDESPVVRLYLASLLQRLDPDLRWGIAEQLLLNDEDQHDHNIPKMIWFGLEPLVEGHPDRALALAGRGEMPLIARFTARRVVDAGALEALVAAIERRPKQQIGLLEGMRDGLEGRRADLLTAPPNWTTVYEELRRSTETAAQLALEVAQLFGDAEASRHFVTLLKDGGAPLERRREALQVLAYDQHEAAAEQLPALLDEPSMRVDAIRAVAEFDDEELGRLLLDRYPALGDTEKVEIIRAMASRPAYGRMLTRAVRDGDIAKRDVPVDVARQLRNVVGGRFIDVWGPIGDELTTGEKEGSTRYRELLTDDAIEQANVNRGRAIFQRTCGFCHRMYGEGGEIGPDITGSNRANLDYLLRNVINPSEEIQDAYRMVVITTREGRTYSGNVVAESERQVTLRVVGLNDVVINKSEIQTRDETETSLMPPRLFEALTDSEVIDLVAYLRTTQQVHLPPE